MDKSVVSKYQKMTLQILTRKKMHSTHLLSLKDTNNMFLWDTDGMHRGTFKSSWNLIDCQNLPSDKPHLLPNNRELDCEWWTSFEKLWLKRVDAKVWWTSSCVCYICKLERLSNVRRKNFQLLWREAYWSWVVRKLQQRKWLDITELNWYGLTGVHWQWVTAWGIFVYIPL